MIQVVKIEDSVGFPLAHDITEIVPGKYKGPAFMKGQIVKRDDLEHLRRLGKNHLYILHPEQYEMHEDEAAVELANALCGNGVSWSGNPREGKIELKANFDGLFKADVDALMHFNTPGDVMCATMHTNTVVKKGQHVASTRAIPLLVPRAKVEAAVVAARSASQGVLRVLPMKKAKAGLIITGDEVYYGRIEDKFEKIMRKKVAEFGGDVCEVVFLPDDDQRISETALRLVESGVNVLITTGGMSVDADDRTRHALKMAGARDIVYGSAVLPGAMFMVAYLKDVPVLGTPACGMYAARTILDLVYPRVLAGEKITRQEIAKLGHGGLCLKCDVCRYPKCTFGKAN
ncbi:Molybdopterin binding domain-containing protein [Desulfosarcina cetonica]|nr:Molybdopterin binding domain-containing protein [Desulfosarcina cetonica]